MTRKHFQLVADLLREANELGLYRSKKGYGQACSIAADNLAETNPQFNRYTFLKACGVL